MWPAEDDVHFGSGICHSSRWRCCRRSGCWSSRLKSEYRHNELSRGVSTVLISSLVPDAEILPCRNGSLSGPGTQTTGSPTTRTTSGTTAPISSSDLFSAVPTMLASPQAGLGVARVECPVTTANASYTVPGTNLKFVRECSGSNYPGGDLGKIPMTNMQDCLKMCAAMNLMPQSSLGPCIGAVWVYEGRQGTDDNFCWLKYMKPKPDPGFTDLESAWL
jgi:hypothetical protein